jgi:type I restriction enzyme, S subunit
MSQIVSLGDIAEVVRGVTYQRESAVSEPREGYIPILRAGNIKDQLILDDDLVWLPTTGVSDRQILRPDDVLMCTSSGSVDVVGKSALFEADDWVGSFGAFCAVIRANQNACVPGYLKHILRASAFLNWARSSLGANIKNIRKSELELFQFNLPMRSDQLSIVTVLDKADSLRRTRQEAIRLADEYLRAAYLDLAERHPARTTVEKLLADVPNAARTGPFGSQLLVSEFTESGIPVLGIDNVVSNAFTWAAPRFISPDKYAELARYTVRPGDVMVTIMGTTGRVAIAPDDLPTCISTKHLCTLTLDHKKMLPSYLWACLRWDPEVKAQTRREAKGAIMEGWNMGIVKGLLVNAPPMDVQLKYEEIAGRIKRVGAAQTLAAKGADELMASLSDKYLAI